MRLRNVDNDLQMRIKRYMEYMHHENTSGYHRGESIINYLPPRLKDELSENIYSKWILNIPILKKNFTAKFLKKLSFKIEEKTYSPEDIIYEASFIIIYYIYYIYLLLFIIFNIYNIYWGGGSAP